MPAIEPINSSAAWDLIESPPLAVISDAQWDLIEHIASQAGEAGRATGDLWQWGTATVDRLVQLAEMPGAAILSVLSHLLMLRREDLLESILAADHDGEIVHELMLRSAKIEAEREKKASHYRPAKQGKPRDQHPATEAAERRRQQRWEDAQANAQETLAEIAGIMEGGGGMNRDRLDKAARLLGINYSGKTEYGASTTPRKDQLREQIDDRIAILESIAPPSPAAVVIEAEPAPGPQDTTMVIEPPQPAGPPPLTAEVLIAEAWAREPMRPTTMASLATWEVLTARGESPDWRRCFGMVSDHHGPNAAAMISGVCGVPFAEVVAYGALVRERHQEDLMELRSAYSSAEDLLADATLAPGWEWLSAAGVRIEALWARCRELTADPRPSAA